MSEVNLLLARRRADATADDGATAPARHYSTTASPADTEREFRRPAGVRATGTDVRSATTVGAAVLLGLASGSLYGFGRYSRALRDALHVSQTDVQRLGMLLDAGNYVGHPLMGYVYDRAGPRISCALAAVMVFCSYLSVHRVLARASEAGATAAVHRWALEVGFFGVGLGSGLGYIAGLGQTTRHFQEHNRQYLGRAVGLVAAGYGLSSTLVGITYHRVGLDRFFLVWAVAVAAVNLVCVAVFSQKLQSPRPTEEEDDIREPLLAPTPETETETEAASQRWDSWKRADFWLLFVSFTCITGGGLFVINNLSTMVQSAGLDDAVAGTLIFVLSLSNVSGRVLAGAASDGAGPDGGRRRLLGGAAALMAVALLVSALLPPSRTALACTVSVAAAAYGASWVLLLGILADVGGGTHFGKNYGLMAMGPALSGTVFNSLSAHLYTQRIDSDSGVCVGAHCYRSVFFLTAGAAALGYVILLMTPTQSLAPPTMPTTRSGSR